MYPCQMNQLSLEHSTAGSVSHGVITLSNQSWPLLLLAVNHQVITVRSEHQLNNRRNHGFHQNSSWGVLWWNYKSYALAFLFPAKSVRKCPGQEMEWGITRTGSTLQVNKRCATVQPWVQSELIKGGSMVKLQGCQQGLCRWSPNSSGVHFYWFCISVYQSSQICSNNFGASQIIKGLTGKITRKSARLLSLPWLNHYFLD